VRGIGRGGRTRPRTNCKGSTLERALHGGEDYELLFTLPSGSGTPKGTTRIGSIVRGRKGKVGFQGKLLPPAGYNHFLPKTK
jgi:thiamine-monophosphate kinase